MIDVVQAGRGGGRSYPATPIDLPWFQALPSNGSASGICLNWRAQESFQTSLAETIDWYLANEGWWRPICDRSYAGERLGAAG